VSPRGKGLAARGRGRVAVAAADVNAAGSVDAAVVVGAKARHRLSNKVSIEIWARG